MKLFLTVLPLAFGLFVLRADDAVALPPEPPLPLMRGLMPEQQEDARTAYRQEYMAWQKRLTQAQRQEYEDRLNRRLKSSGDLPVLDPAHGYEWKVEAQKAGLSPDEIARLGRDKILIEDVMFRQPFEAYKVPTRPFFITSDSILAAFQALFQDSFQSMEKFRVLILRARLERILARMRQGRAVDSISSTKTADAWLYMQYVLGPALRLLGAGPELIDAGALGEIDRQVKKIRNAQEVELPAWMGPPDSSLLALDYRRCKPVGFYAGDRALEDYFRAVKWLQMVPLRISRDTELEAMGLLVAALRGDSTSDAQQFFDEYAWLLGKPDDLTIEDATVDLKGLLYGPGRGDWPSFLAYEREQIKQVVSARTAKVNDQIRLSPSSGSESSSISFRILPGYRLPDAALFQSIADSGGQAGGIAVAAFLGSSFARSRLPPETGRVFERASAAAAPEFEVKPGGSSPGFYVGYLHALAALFDPPAAGAPDFMRGEPWAAKSCQTALAGWAQMRHAFTLQAKESEQFFGVSEAQELPGFVEPNPVLFGRLAELAGQFGGRFEASLSQAVSLGFNGQSGHRWAKLEAIARRLEALSQKQLQRKAWTKEDTDFVFGYGVAIAPMFGYFDDAWERPRDDAPKWAETQGNPATGRMLAEGTGRARLLHVLYPWHGGEILCQGVVVPFYEYQAKDRLTDAEWGALLDSSQAPAIATWIEPYWAH